MTDAKNSDRPFLLKIIPAAAFVGGLCCFSSVVLVLLGLSTTAFAASLSEVLYYQHKWAFRGAALALLLAGMAWHFYVKQNICTLDALRRERRRILNTVFIAMIYLVLAYILWLYVIVEILGILLGIWGLPTIKSLSQIL